MTATSPPSRKAIRNAMFNQGCPLSAAAIHSNIHQGRHGMWPDVSLTQQTLDAMDADGQVKRVGSEEWGFSYWLVPLEGFATGRVGP